MPPKWVKAMYSRMRFRVAGALGVLVLLALTASSAPAQMASGASAQTEAPRRVRFGRGSSRATVQGVVTRDGRGGDYVLRARSGQTLVVTFKAAGQTVFIVKAPNGDDLTGEGSPPGRVELQLTQTGDYAISVINRDGRRRAFSFTFRVR